MARRAPPWRVPEGEDLRDDFDLSELLYRLMGQSAQGVLGSAEATATAIDPYIQALEEYVRRQSDPSAPLLGTGGAEAMGVIGEQILDHAGQVVGGFDEALGSPDYADLAQQGYEGAVHPHVRGAIGAVTDNPVAEKTWEWMTTPPVAEVGRGISAAAGSPLMPDVAKPAAEVAGWLGQNLTPLDAIDAIEPTGVPWAAGVGVGARVAKPFYSKALKAVADVKMPKHLPADQYRKMLAPQYRVMVKEGKKSKKVGQFLDLSEAETVAERVGGTINEIPGRVKGDELAWTGLDDWLKARGNQKTTKAEIQ